MLEIKNLSKTYDGLNYAVKNINLNVSKGEFLAIIGPSGAGKSTLIRLINRLVEPSCGEIFLEGEPILNINYLALKKMRLKIGMVFQHHNLIEEVSVLNNVLHGSLGRTNFFRSSSGLYKREDKEEAERLLEKIGLIEFKCKKAKTLSGGQIQRVGICRALMQKPLLLLADEPIASLDIASAKNVIETIKDTRLTTIINLHQVEFAKKFATRIIGIKKGEITFDGTGKDLTEKIIGEIYG